MAILPALDPALLLSDLPSLGQVAAVLLAIAGAWAAGLSIGQLLKARAARRAGQESLAPASSAAWIATAAAHAVTASLLLLVAEFGDLGPVRRLLLALSLAISVGLLARALLRLLRAGPAVAAAIGVLAGASAAAGLLGGLGPLLQTLDSAAVTVGGHRLSALDLLGIVLLATLLFAAARLAYRLVGQSLARVHGLDASQQLLAQKLAGIGIFAATILLGLDLLGIDLTALAVFSGAFGLAVGFGLQKTLGNLLAGLILLTDRSIKPGDVIVVGDQFGSVNRIGMRAVSVLTRDGKEHLIPNEKLVTDPVENWSFSDRYIRLHIDVGVAYSVDLERAQALMLQAARETARVLADRPPQVWLRSFGESSVDHEILVWIDDPEEGVGNVRSAVLNRLWRLFKENDIELPFPQRDVHIRTLPDGAASLPTSR